MYNALILCSQLYEGINILKNGLCCAKLITRRMKYVKLQRT